VDADEPVIRVQLKNVELIAEFSIDPELVWVHIGEVQTELAACLNIRSSDEPIRIVLFADQKRYEQSLSAEFPQCRRRKAIFVRRGRESCLYSYQSRTLIQDIRHEFTHAILHQHLPFLPIWLDEGLAEYFEEPATSRMNSSRAANVRWKARIGWTPNLTSLESIPSANDIDADSYRDSWAWACLLMNESYESRDLLRDYCNRIHEGEAPPPFSQFLADKLPDLRRRSSSYFRKLTIRNVANVSP
jgi:hypothetical protein